MSSNPVKGRIKLGHPKDLIITLFDLIFRKNVGTAVSCSLVIQVLLYVRVSTIFDAI